LINFYSLLLRPRAAVRGLVHLLVYEAAQQFLDEFGKMIQTSLHSLLQRVSESIGLVCRLATRSNSVSYCPSCVYSRHVLPLLYNSRQWC